MSGPGSLCILEDLWPNLVLDRTDCPRLVDDITNVSTAAQG